MKKEIPITREEWVKLGVDVVVRYAKDGKCSCPKSGHTYWCDHPLVRIVEDVK